MMGERVGRQDRLFYEFCLEDRVPADHLLRRIDAVLDLSDALHHSRYLVLVISNHAENRPWVTQEWTGWIATHGPLGRLLPVKIDDAEVPAILASIQHVDAAHRDVQKTAHALFEAVGDTSTLPEDDERSRPIGQGLVFSLSRDDENFEIVPPSGEARRIPLPWKKDNRFGLALMEFSKLHREPAQNGSAHAELYRHGRTLDGILFDILFDDADAAALRELTSPDRPRPLIQIRSDDTLLLSLPWELLHHDEEFLVREAYVDLVRTTTDDLGGETLLMRPKKPFKLVVNVSAPESARSLSYEDESYRITLATAGRCDVEPTELGTLTDLIETVDRESPTGIHFSGHGKPGALLFEDDKGLDDEVTVEKVVTKLRAQLPSGRVLPPFFYLASCYVNEPVDLDQDKPGSASAAVQLHQAGVTEVVGYYGPIADELSTRAEEALYEAIAEGLPTRDAVRRARLQLAQPLLAADGRLRPNRSDTVAHDSQESVTDTHPFAWAQLVLYRRGPEWPLSVKTQKGKRRSTGLRRTFC